MNRKNILITTVECNPPDIIQSLKTNKNYIIGVDKNNNAVGKFFVDKFFLVPDSMQSKIKFISKLNFIIKKYSIDYLIPCGNDDNLAIIKYKKKINIPVLNSLEFSKKNYFHKHLVLDELKNKLPKYCPKFKNLKLISSNHKFNIDNFIIKPSLNTGGRGVYHVKKNIKFNSLLERADIPTLELQKFNQELKQFKKKNYLIMEKLNGPIVSVYSLCRNGKNFFSISHIREWGNASQTFRGKVFYSKKFEKIATMIIKELKLSYAINMEFAFNKKKSPVLFDLNQGLELVLLYIEV